MNADLRAIARSLPLHDLRCLAAAEGYLELGMYEEAQLELDATSPLCQKLPLAQTIELCICAGLSAPVSTALERRNVGQE